MVLHNSSTKLTKEDCSGLWAVAYSTPMKQTILNFLADDQGQDLIEYTLLMAFVALASAALFLGAGGSIKGIWSTSNSQLEAANAQS